MTPVSLLTWLRYVQTAIRSAGVMPISYRSACTMLVVENEKQNDSIYSLVSGVSLSASGFLPIHAFPLNHEAFSYPNSTDAYSGSSYLKVVPATQRNHWLQTPRVSRTAQLRWPHPSDKAGAAGLVTGENNKGIRTGESALSNNSNFCVSP